MLITDIMTTRVVTVEMDDTLHVVKEIFDNTRFHHLLVVRRDKLVGVVSDRDLLKALSPYLGTAAEIKRDVATLEKRVHQIMTRELVTLPLTATVRDAIAVFNGQRISCIPIVDEAAMPTGIVSWRDILKGWS